MPPSTTDHAVSGDAATYVRSPAPWSRVLVVDAVICALLLLSPFVIFVRHHRYPLLSAEAGMVSAALAALAVLAALPAARWPRLRPPIIAALVVSWLDIQFSVLTVPWIAAAFVALTALLFLMRRREAPLLIAVAATILVTTIVLPGRREAVPPPLAPGRADLPLVVHLILDEQIGIEGMPADLLPGLASGLRAALEGRGFAVFGGAYSQYFNSHFSIAHLVNFVHDQPQIDLVAPSRVRFPLRVQRNVYFETMAARGYRLHALLPDYLGLCPDALRDRAACDVYSATMVQAARHTSMATGDRTRLLWRSYQERFTALQTLLPGLAPRPVRLTAVAADRAIATFRGIVANARPGDLYLTHLLLPHYPYVFTDECQLRPMAEWVYRQDPAAPPGQSNTPAGRADRYRAYGSQVRCAERRVLEILDAIPAALRDQAVVIVQGDHGSRLGLREALPDQQEFLSDADLIDGFSTLFAVRAPGVGTEYDVRAAAIPCLLEAFVEAGFRDRGGVDACAVPPRVFLAAPDNTLVERPLPEFRGNDTSSRQ